MKHLFTIIFCILLYSAAAQHTEEVKLWRFDPVPNYQTFNYGVSWLPSGNAWYTFGTRRSQGLFDAHQHMLKFNRQGELLSTLSISSATHSAGNIRPSVPVAGGFLLEGQLGTNTGNWSNVIGLMDTNGNVLYSRRYNPLPRLLLETLVFENKWFAFSYPAGTFTRDFHIVKGEVNGAEDVLCVRYNLDTAANYRILSSEQGEHGNMYLGFEFQSTVNEALLVKMRDTAVVWSKQYIGWSNPTNIRAVAPNRLWVNFSRLMDGSSQRRSIWAVLDTNGNIIKAMEYALSQGNYSSNTYYDPQQSYHIGNNTTTFKRYIYRLDTLGNISAGRQFNNLQNASAGVHQVERNGDKYAVVVISGANSRGLVQVIDEPDKVCGSIATDDVQSSPLNAFPQVRERSFTKSIIPLTVTSLNVQTTTKQDFTQGQQCVSVVALQPSLAAYRPTVYPNPLKDKLNLTVINVQHAQLRLLNAQGQTLDLPTTTSSGEDVLSLDCSHLPPGLYILQAAEHIIRFVKE